jgi:hypothetical protein
MMKYIEREYTRIIGDGREPVAKYGLPIGKLVSKVTIPYGTITCADES